MTDTSNSTDTDYADCFDIKAVAARVHAALFPEIPIDAPIKALADFEPPRAEQVQAQAAQSPRRQHKPRIPPPDGLKTAAQAAAKLGCSVKTLNAHVDAGDLRYVSIGKGTKRPRKMFTDPDLNEFIASQTRKDVPCPSIRTETVARRIFTSTSNSVVLGFTAQRNARRAAKPKK